MSVDISPLDFVRHATYHKRYYIAAHIEIEAFPLMSTIVTEELLDLEMTRKVSWVGKGYTVPTASAHLL
jgi:hypothetical protein